MKLSPVSIYAAALGAKFAPADAMTMTAIALAESQGETTAHNRVPPDDSYGVWQINMLHDADAKRRAFGITTDAELFDPKANARAAHVIFGWQGFDAWSTWLHGTFRRYLPQARAAAADYAHASSSPSIGRVLRFVPGVSLMAGRDVAGVQRVVGAQPDGMYGPATAAAVRAWQRGHHLQSDGVWGPESTRAAGWRWVA